MANKRIQKKRAYWRKPLREVHLSEADAMRRFDRIVQRLKRHPEVYYIRMDDGADVAMVSYRWMASARQMLASKGIDPDGGVAQMNAAVEGASS
jgi:hypothetical protein